MKNFSSIKELLGLLSREQRLISEIFEKRKVLAYKVEDALKVLDYNEDKLRILLEFGVLRENGRYYLLQTDQLLYGNWSLSRLADRPYPTLCSILGRLFAFYSVRRFRIFQEKKGSRSRHYVGMYLTHNLFYLI